MLKKDLKLSQDKPSILSGLMFCKDCGSSMFKRIIKNKRGETVFYFCSQHSKNGKCFYRKVSENYILETTRNVIKSKIGFYKDFIYKIDCMDNSKMNFTFLDVQIDNLNKEKQREISLRNNLYIDFEDGLIDLDDFEYFNKICSDKIKEIDKQILLKKENLENIKDKFISKQFYPSLLGSNKDYLDRLTLLTLIDYIEVDRENNLNFVFNDYEGLETISNIIKTSSDLKEVL